MSLERFPAYWGYITPGPGIRGEPQSRLSIPSPGVSLATTASSLSTTLDFIFAMFSPTRADHSHIRPGSSSDHPKGASVQDDIRNKYPEDNYSEEMGPNASVWKLCLDVAEGEDSKMFGNWEDTVNVLLVFAGLFSSVVTTLVIQASQSLQKDYQQVTATLIQELIMVQRAAASNQPVTGVPASTMNTTSSFTADNLSRWVNGLWFTSLALSMSVALLAVLIKQWIHNYTVSNSLNRHRDRVASRQYRHLGLHAWHVPAIVQLLPLLLHVSVLVFFAGLILFLHPLNIALSWVVTGVGAISYFVYFVTPWFPLWNPQCPYKSSLTQVAREVPKLLSVGLCLVIERFADLCERIALKSEKAIRLIRGVEERLHRVRRDILENPRISVRVLEEMEISKSWMKLTIQALESVHKSLTNPDIRTIILEAYAGMDIQINEALLWGIQQNQKLQEDLRETFLSCFHFENRQEAHLLKGQEGKVERLARAFLRLQLGVPKTYDERLASCWDYLHLRSEEPTVVPLALLAKSSCFVYQEDYSFLTQEVDDQSFIDICLRGKLKLSVWIWVQLEEQVIQRNLRDCFDDGDTVGLLQMMDELITALPSDYENDQSRYTVLVLHSLGCDRTDCPEVHPECRDRRRLLIHALVGILKQCDHETLLAFVQHLYNMTITGLDWSNDDDVNSTEGSRSSSDISDDAGDIFHDHHRAEDQTQLCLTLLRELQGELLDYLIALFDEKLQEDVLLISLTAVDSEVLIVPEFCFELHHRIRTQTWNEDLMMKAMYCLAIGWGPTTSMFLFLKDCFESAGSSRAVELFRDLNGFDALWLHARSRGKDGVRLEARSILFSYYMAAARSPPNLADSVFGEDSGRLKDTDIFMVVFENIFAELQKTRDQHLLEMPNLVANFQSILKSYEKFGNGGVWRQILYGIASRNRETPPSYDRGRNLLISTFRAIEELKLKVHAQEARFDLYYRPIYENGPTSKMTSLHPRSLFDRLREGFDRTEEPPAPPEPMKFDIANFNPTIELPQRNDERPSLSPRVSRDALRGPVESGPGSPLQQVEHSLAFAAYQRWRRFVGRTQSEATPPSEPV